MTVTSRGFVGALVPGVPWAQMQWVLGREYVVQDETAWRVTAVGGGTRQVSVAAGVGGGKGILDVNDAASTVTLPTVATGTTSYFMVVARRTWGSTSGSSGTVFTSIGPSASATALPTKNSTPGTLDDQPLALFSLTGGSTIPVLVADLRLIGTGHGILIAMSDLVRQFVTQPGSQIRIVPLGTEWVRSLNNAGTAQTWSQTATQNTPLSLPVDTQSDVWVSQDLSGVGTGWSGAGSDTTAVYCRGIGDGNRAEMWLNLRRTGARMVPDSFGGVTDVQVGTTTPAYRPYFPIPGIFIYRGGTTATQKATFHGSCTLYPTGQLNINALSPGIPLNQTADAVADWSARFYFHFSRKVVA